MQQDPQPTSFKRSFAADAIIFRQGEPGDTLYLIQSGRVEVVAAQGGDVHVLTVLGEGDLLGETSVINRRPREGTARALLETEALEVDARTFELMIKGNLEVAVRVIRKLAARLDDVTGAYLSQHSGLSPAEVTHIASEQRGADIIPLHPGGAPSLRATLPGVGPGPIPALVPEPVTPRGAAQPAPSRGIVAMSVPPPGRTGTWLIVALVVAAGSGVGAWLWVREPPPPTRRESVAVEPPRATAKPPSATHLPTAPPVAAPWPLAPPAAERARAEDTEDERAPDSVRRRTRKRPAGSRAIATESNTALEVVIPPPAATAPPSAAPAVDPPGEVAPSTGPAIAEPAMAEPPTAEAEPARATELEPEPPAPTPAAAVAPKPGEGEETKAKATPAEKKAEGSSDEKSKKEERARDDVPLGF